MEDKDMRKMISGLAVMAAVFIMGSATVMAAEAADLSNSNSLDADASVACVYCGVSCSFVDADGDGICDNYAAQLCGTGAGFVDADGDGICDNYGTYGCGMGAGYVDADGDGICDNYGTYGCGRGRGGRGYGRGRCWR